VDYIVELVTNSKNQNAPVVSRTQKPPGAKSELVVSTKKFHPVHIVMSIQM